MTHRPRGIAAALAALVMLAAVHSGSPARAADNPQQAFVRKWERTQVVVKQTLYTLVYNERGKLGNTRSALREGLTVVTPFEGTYFFFAGRQSRDDVQERNAESIVEAVDVAYQPDSLELRSYRKVEPVSLARIAAGTALVVRAVRIERDAVRLLLAAPGAAATDEAAATSLTIKWPMPFSKSFSEGGNVEALIRQFVDAAP